MYNSRILWGIFSLTASAVQASPCSILAAKDAAREMHIASFGEYSEAPYVQPRLRGLVGYEKQAWTELFDYIASYGDPYATLSYDLLPLILNLPPEIRLSIDAQVRSAYEIASKEDNNPSIEHQNKIYAPRRALDFYIHATTNPWRTVKEALDSGKSPVDAIDAYYTEMRQRFFPNSAARSYGFREILSVGEEIRAYLMSTSSAFAAKSIHNPSYIVFGSFPNGRANILMSDIDIAPTAPPMRDWNYSLANHLKKSLASDSTLSKAHTNVAELAIGMDQVILASPIQLHISADAIHVRVYQLFPANRWHLINVGGGMPPREHLDLAL